jgi:hypothetical protein
VIWSEPDNALTTTTYMVVTSTEYGGYDKDNGYYLNITGYDINGKSITVKGAFGDDTFVYGTKTDAQDYQADIGIYRVITDIETGFVSLTDEPAGEESSAEQVLAGDPDAVDSDTVSDSETVFVVANYSAKGAITGYDVYTGIKSIKDLKNAGLDEKVNTVIYPEESVTWGVTYVDFERVDSEGEDVTDGRVNLVLVLGAKQSTDVKLSSSIQPDEVFYLLDEVPEMQFADYNRYTVVYEGKLTTLDIDVNAEGSATDYDTQLEGTGFYKINAWAGDYVYGCEKIEATEVDWAGVDVLSIGSGNESIWKYASCHEGEGDQDGSAAFITLADNCKLYDLTNGKVVEIKATDLLIDQDLDTPVNELGYEVTNCVVADYDSYGFATVIYVVDATNG